MSYQSELNRKMKLIKQRILKAETELDQMKTSHPSFIEKYKSLNLLRIDLETVKSRIKNLDNFPGGIMETEYQILTN